MTSGGRWRRVRWLVLGLVVLVAGTSVAEGVVRSREKDRIAQAAERVLGSPVDVGIGPTPALLDLARGEMASVSVRSASAELCKLSDLAFDAALQGVRPHDGGVRADAVRASVTLTPGTFATAMSAELGLAGSQVRVLPDPARSQLVISAGPGGMFVVNESVRLVGDVLTISPASASAAGRDLSSPVLDRLAGKATIQRSLSDLPYGLKLSSVRVTGSGVVVTARGGETVLNRSSTAAPRCSE